MTPEGLITQAILRWLNNQPGIRAIKMHASGFQGRGEPDIHVTCRITDHTGRSWGQSMWLEVKQPGERATPIQQWCQHQWRKAGATSTTVYTLRDVQKLVRSLGHNMSTNDSDEGA